MIQNLGMNDSNWSIDSWAHKTFEQEISYTNLADVETVIRRLRRLPPLVTSWEVERLKSLIAEAQQGKRFLLQGGDCAETFDECQSHRIANKLKILLQMSLVLIHSLKRPVIRVGRFAGQYAKPRTRATEIRNGQELPSYFGDLTNRAEFSEQAREIDPDRMLLAYYHASVTLNFVRALTHYGFANLSHPEYWDLSFFHEANLSVHLQHEYEQTRQQIAEALRFMEAIGETRVSQISQVEFFTSHEGLNLHYESAQTRTVPHRSGYYDLTTHLPWIGDRTRSLDGAHVEFFRGIQNPIGIKIGPSIQPSQLVQLAQTLNPTNERGKILLITRLGVQHVESILPSLIQSIQDAGLYVLWVCDPMHGNTHTLNSGIKTRKFDEILDELKITFEVHSQLNSYLGGVHFELTGEDVTECLGGAEGLTEQDLSRNYASVCDPRLNYAQALEMSFHIARCMK